MINTESQFFAKIQHILTRRRNPNVLSEKEAEEMLEYLQVRRIRKAFALAQKKILKQRKEKHG